MSFKYLLLYRFKIRNGGLAQLASAFDWQSKGHGFESRILHNDKALFHKGFFHIQNFGSFHFFLKENYINVSKLIVIFYSLDL